MPRYGRASMRVINSCTGNIRRVFMSVVRAFDNTAMEGFRDEKTQTAAFKAKRSKVEWPNGKHNKKPSEAIDAVPYPIRWPNEAVMRRVLAKINEDAELRKYVKDLARFYAFGGFVKGVAHEQGVKIRWGGDWDGDWDFGDQTFDDLVHFEEE